MRKISAQELLDAGVHFGHLKSKWDPHIAPYVFMEKNGIHLIDLNKTVRKLDEARKAAYGIARSGRKILFVATKKQAKDLVSEAAQRVEMPYVTDRWLGGMLTNFATVRKSIKKMTNIDKMMTDGTVENLAKRERLMLQRERQKLEKVLGGIKDLSRIPAAIYIVDIKKERIAMREAQKLGLTSLAICDTNTNPNDVDYPVPGNDDATKSIQLITEIITEAIEEGLQERRQQKEMQEKKGQESTGEEEEVGEEEDNPTHS
jgi:small subunit ribosomal protein S2